VCACKIYSKPHKLTQCQIELYTSTHVCTHHDSKNLLDMMPTEDDEDYDFYCRPRFNGRTPPLRDKVLFHKFRHPAGCVTEILYNSNQQIASYDTEVRNRLPKRLSPLAYKQNEGWPFGYALEFVEGFNWTLWVSCEAFIITVALIFPILWCFCTSRDDRVSTAVSIGQWILGAGQVVYIVALVLSEMFCFWRY
jgi:hypothetical protein